jgi:hypothetical protein
MAVHLVFVTYNMMRFAYVCAESCVLSQTWYQHELLSCQQQQQKCAAATTDDCRKQQQQQ